VIEFNDGHIAFWYKNDPCQNALNCSICYKLLISVVGMPPHCWRPMDALCTRGTRV